MQGLGDQDSLASRALRGGGSCTEILPLTRHPRIEHTSDMFVVRCWLYDFFNNQGIFCKGIFSGPRHVVLWRDICSYLMFQPFSATQEVSGKAVEIFHYCRAVQLSNFFFFLKYIIDRLFSKFWMADYSLVCKHSIHRVLRYATWFALK